MKIHTATLICALALVAAACGGNGSATNPTASTSTTSTSTTSTPTSSTSTSPSSTTAAPTSTTSTTVPGIEAVRVYFLVDDITGEGPFLRPVHREIAPTLGVARAAITELVAGPTPDERAGTPAITGGLPDGTELLGLKIRDGTATVDFSEEVDDIGGTFGELSVLGQIVFTLTQFPTVDNVVLMIEGEAIEDFGSHGIGIAPSMSRQDFLGGGLVPEILIDAPAMFAEAGSPLTVTGIGRLFEATADWALYDDDGLPLAEGFTMASEGGPGWGTFEFTISYEVDRSQLGTLMMWEESAEDGSRQHIAEHPVWLGR